VAWAAIDRSETLDLVIHGSRGGLAKRALPRGRLLYEASERRAAEANAAGPAGARAEPLLAV